VIELLDQNSGQISTKLHFSRMASRGLEATTRVSSTTNISTNSFRFSTSVDQ